VENTLANFSAGLVTNKSIIPLTLSFDVMKLIFFVVTSLKVLNKLEC
jgi:hypothetical protein